MKEQYFNDLIKKIEEAKKEIESNIGTDYQQIQKKVSSQLLDVITEQTYKFIESLEERKKIEEELRLFSRAAEQSGSSIVITNTNGRIIYVNKKFCDLTGYSKEEAIGKTPRILKSGEQDSEFYKKLWDTIKSGKDWQGEFHNKKKDGSLYWEHAVISPVKNEKGEITHYMAIKDDITETKEALEALEKHRKLLEQEIETKDKFFSIISHDLRSPFTAILGYAEILDEDFDELSDEEKHEYISSLRKSASNTLNLLESLLTWARAQTGRLDFQPEDLVAYQVVEEVVQLYLGTAEKKHIKIFNKFPTDKTIFADEEMLKTILRNFISNALKFTPSGGEISIGYNSDESYYLISVKDTGVGISNEYKEKIFQIGTRFTTPGTENEQGTGFGLALVAELVKLHHGKISVISEPGQGSEFIIHIPKNLKEILEKNAKN